MMGLLVRLNLYLKLWFTSFYTIVMMLFIPVVGVLLYNSGSYTIEDASSIIYEKAAPIWFIFILQWCFSIDMDSKFYSLVVTYPISRWRFIMERVLFSALVFVSLLAIVTASLMPIMGAFAWQSFLFTMPVYIAIVGFAVVGTVMINHSLGGLLAGIIIWVFYVFGATFLGNLNVILLKYGSVYTFVNGETGFFDDMNRWILYNRLFYMMIGLLLTGLAILQFNRRTT